MPGRPLAINIPAISPQHWGANSTDEGTQSTQGEAPTLAERHDPGVVPDPQRTAFAGIQSVSATPSCDPTDYAQRVLGAILGAACGDVLGAAVEGDYSDTLSSTYPQGLTTFQNTVRGFGCYTDDTQMMVALARSLVKVGRCDAAEASHAYAAEFQPHRGYGKSAYMILKDLLDGADWRTTAQQYIPGGSFGNGGAMRIAPVGLAYRHAPPHVLLQAVEDALVATHTHPLGIDGAFIQAAAVAVLSTSAAGWVSLFAGSTVAATSAQGRGIDNIVRSADNSERAAYSVQRVDSTPAAGDTSQPANHTERLEGGEAVAALPATAAPTCEGAPAAAAATAAPEEQTDSDAATPTHISAFATAAAAAAAATAAIGSDAPEETTDGGAASARDAADPFEAAGTERAVMTPALQLLQRMSELARTQDMRTRLQTLATHFNQVPLELLKRRETPWADHLQSEGWAAELAVAARIADAFQIRATDAAASALCALVFHWDVPEDAVVAAVHYGGDTDTIACMAGALAGALHGSSWLPAHWVDNLENGPAGRDDIVRLAGALARLICRTDAGRPDQRAAAANVALGPPDE